MHILIIEGNAEAGSRAIEAVGGTRYSTAYGAVPRKLDPTVTITPAFPAEAGPDAWPNGTGPDDFDGAVITGSSLDVFKNIPAVTNQLRFVDEVVGAGLPVFGSCWGLQVLVTVYGGKVSRNERGREIGISPSIELNDIGKTHPMYEGKAPRFEAFTVHLDHTIALPDSGTLLAANAMSPVQALGFGAPEVAIWGVQYHPEFDKRTMRLVFQRLQDQLIAERLFASPDEVRKAAILTTAPETYDQTELKNWLALIDR